MSLPPYQPKFVAWLRERGFAAYTPTDALPDGWQVDFLLWSMKK